jgi:hypothetical protein
VRGSEEEEGKKPSLPFIDVRELGAGPGEKRVRCMAVVWSVGASSWWGNISSNLPLGHGRCCLLEQIDRDCCDCEKGKAWLVEA